MAATILIHGHNWHVGELPLEVGRLDLFTLILAGVERWRDPTTVECIPVDGVEEQVCAHLRAAIGAQPFVRVTIQQCLRGLVTNNTQTWVRSLHLDEQRCGPIDTHWELQWSGSQSFKELVPVGGIPRRQAYNTIGEDI